MAKVIITKKLEEEINKKFKKESVRIFELMYSLKESPHKGKELGQVGGILIKELRYGSFRFYFITDGCKLKFLGKEELDNLLIKFIRMSDKKTQQKVINEIKDILRRFGREGF
jgi:hypothetical protein